MFRREAERGRLVAGVKGLQPTHAPHVRLRLRHTSAQRRCLSLGPPRQPNGLPETRRCDRWPLTAPIPFQNAFFELRGGPLTNRTLLQTPEQLLGALDRQRLYL